jgi:hypothetical protein
VLRRSAAVLALCGVAAAAATAAGSTLVFHRADGSRIAFAGRLYAWCGPWESDVKVPSVHVWLVPPRRRGAYWMLSGVLKDVRRQPRVRFPIGFVWNRPKGAELFVYDKPTRNEASSETEHAKGVVTFSRVSCRLGDEVVISARGALGSEFGDGTPVRVSGTFRGTVGKPPRGFAISTGRSR